MIDAFISKMTCKALIPKVNFASFCDTKSRISLNVIKRHIRTTTSSQGMYCCGCQRPSAVSNNGPHRKLLADDIRNINWYGGGRCQFSFLSVVSVSPPVLAMQDMLQYFDNQTGLPWWTTIILVTVGFRTLITFPFMIYQNYIIAKYANLQPEIAKLAAELKRETAAAVKLFNWNEKQAKLAFKRSLKKHVKSLIERDNCHPFKASVVMWIQIPVWFSMSFALRNMVTMMPNQDLAAQVIFQSLATGGFLWITDLTSPDTSLILPVCCGLFNIIITEVHALKTLKTTKLGKFLTWMLRCVSVIMIPIAATVPSCLCIYWTTSSFVGLLQNFLLMSPRFRQLCGIPKVPGESETPFLLLKENFKRRFLRKSS